MISHHPCVYRKFALLIKLLSKMLHFGTRSTKGKNLLECSNKLFSKVKFTRKDDEITKCYWACINISKGCKAKIQYDVDLDVAGLGHDGMSNGIINIVAKDHDDEYCDTNADDILVRNARNTVLVKATEG
jgi:hypothetical protein